MQRSAANVILESARTAEATEPASAPACPTCGTSKNVAVPPLHIEIIGTMDMITEYYCAGCRASFRLK